MTFVLSFYLRQWAMVITERATIAVASCRSLASVEIAEVMGKNKGTVSKWSQRALREKRIKRAGNKLLPFDEPQP